MPVINCPDPTKPIVTTIASPLFGFPRGTEDRDDVEIQGILIHCVDTLTEYQACQANAYGEAGRPTGILKQSLHFGIPINGRIQQYIAEENIAWGLAPILAQGASEPTYSDCDNSLTWDLTEENEDVAPDKYLIHIAIEASKERVISSGTLECTCDINFAENNPKTQSRQLVELVAFLASEYEITIDSNHINFLHNVDPCKRNECGCNPCIDQLICAIDDYCQVVENAKDTTFQENEETEITALYGEDQYGNKKKITAEEVFAFFISGAIRIPNRTNWENELRNAPTDKEIIFSSGTYLRTQLNPIELKAGQVITGRGQRVTRIVDPTGRSFLRFTGTVNLPVYTNYRLQGLDIEQTVSPIAGNAGFEDTAGAQLWMVDMGIRGYDSGIILNQTETVNIRDSYFGNCKTHTLWIVNGAQRVIGANGGYSNDIHFIGCTFSGGNFLTDYLIRDDGGDGRAYRDCLFNGGATQLFMAGVKGYIVDGCYMEGAGTRVMRLDYQTANGDEGPGRILGGKIEGNLISAGALVTPVVQLISGDGLSFCGNAIFGTSSGYVFNDNPDFSGIIALGNVSTMRTWQTAPNTRSLSRNQGMGTLESFMIGMGYPITPENATDEAIQIWWNSAKRQSVQNSGNVISGSSQSLSAAGAVSLALPETEITTIAATAYILAAGVNGQSKWIGMVANGGNATITVTNGSGFTAIVLDDVGQCIELKYKADKWWIGANNGATII